MTDVNLYKKVSHLNGLLQRRRLRRRTYGGPAGDPTRGQGRILSVLKLQDGIPTKDLSYLLDMRVASLNELLGKLERAGFVVREPSEADRRVMLIKLTNAGREQPQQNPDADDAFAALSEDEQAALGTLLDRVIDALETETYDANADAFDAWMDDARQRMGDEKFDQWMGRLSDRFGEDGRQVMAERWRRNLERARAREERARMRGRRRGGPGFRGPGFDDPRFGGPPGPPPGGPAGGGPAGPGFGGPARPAGPDDPRVDGPIDPRLGGRPQPGPGAPTGPLPGGPAREQPSGPRPGGPLGRPDDPRFGGPPAPLPDSGLIGLPDPRFGDSADLMPDAGGLDDTDDPSFGGHEGPDHTWPMPPRFDDPDFSDVLDGPDDSEAADWR